MNAKVKKVMGALWAGWKRLRAKFPVWPRRWKVLRNLTVAAVLMVLVPEVLDWPVFGREAALRRLEAQALLSPSELVLRVGNAFVTEGEDWITVGIVNHYDSNWKLFQKDHPEIFHVVPKGDVTVFLLPELEDGKLVAVAAGLPDGAQRGVLDLAVANRSAEAVRNEEGWMVFRIEEHSLDWLDLRGKIREDSYTLELLDASGKSVRRVEGKLPDYLVFLTGQHAQ